MYIYYATIYNGSQHFYKLFVFAVITENKKSLTYGEVKDDENKNLIDDNIIPKEEEKNASNSEEIKEEDVKEIAYKLCLEENPNFDTLEDWRKEFFIGMKISKLLRGDM